MLLPPSLVLLGLASQLSPTAPDPPVATSQAASTHAVHLVETTAPTSPDNNTAESASAPSTHLPAAEAQSRPTAHLELPPEVPPEPSSIPDEVREHQARDTDQAPPTDSRQTYEAEAPPTLPPSPPDDSSRALMSICRAHEQAQTIRFAGMGLGLAGVIGAAAFASIALYERGQAQDLLDSSPAFGKVGDVYVQRDASHPDVASYQSHRDTASIMGQLGWVGLGVSAAGLSAVLSASWLDAQLEDCPDAER